MAVIKVLLHINSLLQNLVSDYYNILIKINTRCIIKQLAAFENRYSNYYNFKSKYNCALSLSQCVCLLLDFVGMLLKEESIKTKQQYMTGDALEK